MKIRRLAILVFLLMLLVGCSNKLDKEVTLTGEIITREIMVNSEGHKVSILDLDEPLVIQGIAVNSVKLSDNKDIENNTKVVVQGILEENKDEDLDIRYEVNVKNILQ